MNTNYLKIYTVTCNLVIQKRGRYICSSKTTNLMKNLTFFCALLLLFSSFTSVSYSQNVSFKMKRPPLNQLSVSDFYNIDIVNSSSEKIEFYLYGTLTESKAGLIATATTVPITLGPKERKQFKASDLPKTPDISYPNSDNRYKEALMRKGSLPDGNYTICIYGKQTGTNEEIGNDCIEQEISIQSEAEISLLTPDNKSKIESDEPVIFSWLPIGTVTTSATGAYKIKIVEIIRDESPETAILKNKAFFEKEEIRNTTFQYPSSAPKLELGKRYAWQISTGSVLSPVSIFDRWGNLAPAFTLSSPRNGGIVNGDSVIFEWGLNIGLGTLTVTATQAGYKIKIVEIFGDQSPENAILKNKAFFKKEGIRNTTFQYPSSAPKFVAGNKYAWSIGAGDWQSDGAFFQVAGVLSGTVSGPAGPISGTINIVSPVNGELVNGDSVIFKFECGNCGTLADVDGLGTRYKIKIVELKGDESPENAMLKNKAFFEREPLQGTLFQYPSSAPKFIPGNKYAWSVVEIVNKTLDVIVSLNVFEVSSTTGLITNNGTINDLVAPTGGDSIMPAKVSFKMKRPPLNHLNIGDLLNGTFTNTGESTTLYVYSSLKNSETGELIATYGPFSLTVRKAGTDILEYLKVNPEINFLSKDKKYDSFRNKGNAPEGNYTVCVELRYTDNTVAGIDCYEQKISGKK